MDICVSVIVVTRNADLFHAGASVISDLRDTLFDEVTLDSDWSVLDHAMPEAGPHYQTARTRAIRALAGHQNRLSLNVVHAQSLSGALDRLQACDRRDNVHHIGMAYIDYSDPYHAGRSTAEIENDLNWFYDRLRARNLQAFQTPTSTAVFQSAEMPHYHIHPMNFIRCLLPGDMDVLRAHLLSLWMDFYELSLANRKIRPGSQKRPTSLMASTLAAFLAQQAGSNWILQYYTGSVVSSLITAFEDQAAAQNVPVLRGPNEHSLACGAMANWQLYEKPSVTIVTSGMIDEFRGTFANLYETRARGFLICAEQKPALWYAFQSTINPEFDSRDVLHARGVPFVYISEPQDLARGLEQAMALYAADRGPVVILATQAVMNMAAPPTPRVPAPCVPVPAQDQTQSHAPPAALDDLVDLVNGDAERLLLQPGALPPRCRQLVTELAEASGIALVDSILHPGMVASHHNGRPNPNYLGTLGVYGFSDPVYRYLYRGGRIAPRETQALIFMEDKISQAATPFGESKLRQQFQIAQIVRRSDHLAPFADLAIRHDPEAALAYLLARLDISDALLARRRAAIALAREGEKDLSSSLPVLPMTPNYFFGQLGALLRHMIEAEGYDFTGLYDVGRCGISAIRNLPRTRAGFSGWYGRALMGDAYTATVALAQTAATDLLVFVGDGARALVPDILPSLLENALANGARRDLSVTIFVLANSGLSAINSYQERILFNRTSRQMRVLNLGTQDSQQDMCGYQVVTRAINTFDPDALRHDLRKRGRINLFTVNLAHNNEGDGMSLAHVSGWQQDQLAGRRNRPLRAHTEERI
ncbi:hypothetical protein [Thioclava sp. GXIMD4216]|uniref:hypothetical protein n=1 Tax=Thioclava sp. GXIMD4216 TaxID=3131929 RepID=UPI0030D2CEDA